MERVSVNFPRVPKGCERTAQTFFDCFYEKGKQPKGTHDPEAGNKALQSCSTYMQAYNTCVDAATAKAPRKLTRVPEVYRVRQNAA